MSTGFSTAIRGELLDELLDARMQHMQWVGEVMNNEHPQAELDHTRCQFGLWMQRVSGILNHLPEFHALEQPHQLLHQSYRELRDDPDHDQLKQQVKTHSTDLIDAIDALEKQINRLR